MGLHLTPRPASNVVHLADHAVPSYRRARPALARPGSAPSHGGTWGAMARQRATERMAGASNDVAALAPVAAVRVTRVSEPVQMPGAAGRLRISGRLIDVCAELERLAEAEARAAALRA